MLQPEFRPWILIVFCVSLLLLTALPGDACAEHPYRAALRLKDLKLVSLGEMLADLRGVDLVFIGESHDDTAHHQAQLGIISALHEGGRDIAIGLEMFRSEAQRQLDLWTSGRLDRDSFIRLYYDNWRLPWPLYEDILLYAREHSLPLVGLNIPDAVAGKISREGFSSLTPDERKQLPPGISCSVDPRYMDFIRRAHRAHGGDGGKSFVNFCEAQMVWDKAMAWRLAEYRKRHPRRSMVVLAGAGHAWKPGIPAQVAEMGKYSVRVVLPGSPGMRAQQGIGADDADYILLR